MNVKRPPAPIAPPKEPLSLQGATLRGNRQAKVAIEEFTDYQCPYCGKLATNTLPTVMREYVDSGKVLFALRNLPLQELHPWADPAARAALCAGEQGRYWPMHDVLFGNQKALNLDGLHAAARTVDLAKAEFDACLSSEAIKVRLQEDQNLAAQLRVTGTPTLFVGRLEDGRLRVTQRFGGAQSASVLKSVLDRLLDTQ